MRRRLLLMAVFAIVGAAQQTEVGVIGPVYRPGDGVTSPEPTYNPQPEYSEEARKAKLQGSVFLSVLVNETGKPVNAKVVVRPLGLGLDEKALITVVTQWKFKPGMKDGKPVAVRAQFEVAFRLPEK
jgi:protein TonB